LIIYGHCRV